MEIFPAIDLRSGKVVRLRQGEANAQTTYSDQPVRVARMWADEGARWLHVVNLDGAFGADRAQATADRNIEALEGILESVGVPIQFGGGLRSLDGIAEVLERGVARVVLGTLAIECPQIVREALERFGAERVVVGLDARSGDVATHGWQRQSLRAVAEVAGQMAALGVSRAVFTDIARDGSLAGVNVGATRELALSSGLKVIASGGVASLDDVRALQAVEADGVEGVIIGQALYTGAIRLADAIQIAG